MKIKINSKINTNRILLNNDLKNRDTIITQPSILSFPQDNVLLCDRHHRHSG